MARTGKGRRLADSCQRHHARCRVSKANINGASSAKGEELLADKDNCTFKLYEGIGHFFVDDNNAVSIEVMNDISQFIFKYYGSRWLDCIVF